jgi:hypothetical protein
MKLLGMASPERPDRWVALKVGNPRDSGSAIFSAHQRSASAVFCSYFSTGPTLRSTIRSAAIFSKSARTVPRVTVVGT